MLILDTNVVSEAMRPVPEAQVLEWLARQPVSEICTTAVTEAEILAGIAQMPEGRRRQEFLQRAELMFESYFECGVFPFDRPAARYFAAILAQRRRAGRPIAEFDAQIAAIARVHGATVATRNVRDFDGCGIKVVNPWEGR